MSTDRAESLFEVEAALRSAALKYAGHQSSENRKALRDAAIAYADFASFLDDLVNVDEVPDELRKQLGGK